MYGNTGSSIRTLTEADQWMLVVVTKSSGTTLPRFHFYSLAGGTWVHENGSRAIGDEAAPGADGTIRWGKWQGTDALKADIDVAAIWAAEFFDVEVESLATNLTASAWLNIRPAGLRGLWDFGADATLVDLTGGGANEVFRSGTQVVSGP